MGVYVHVPYCVARCPYCDFNSVVVPSPPWESFTAAVVAEIAARAEVFDACSPMSVYFGGGTPSLAPAYVFESILTAVDRYIGPWKGHEVSVEANPKTIDAAGFAALRSLGVDRVSIGWQSTHDRLLRYLGRGHTASESAACAAAARSGGFDNLSIDLIFAVPGQTHDDLDRDLDAIEALAPQHVSLYVLTYHQGTELHRRWSRGEVLRFSDDEELRMMARIEARLTAAGFEHYEVSNYARPGFRAVHNSLYWTGVRYLGIGPGAHSFARFDWERGWRWESIRAVDAYLDVWSSGRDAGLPRDGDASIGWIESLSARQMMTERMLCGLRLGDGLDLSEPVVARFRDEMAVAIGVAESRGWALLDGSRLRPTGEGLNNADALAALFF
ncbi:MAG: radical SAM family heme chaperone HemW [Myxococcota bacterium]